MMMMTMMIATITAMMQVDLSDVSFEKRLGEVRKLWQQITDKTQAGACAHRASSLNFCNNLRRNVSRGVGDGPQLAGGPHEAVPAAHCSGKDCEAAAGAVVRVFVCVLVCACVLLCV